MHFGWLFSSKDYFKVCFKVQKLQLPFFMSIPTILTICTTIATWNRKLTNGIMMFVIYRKMSHISVFMRGLMVIVWTMHMLVQAYINIMYNGCKTKSSHRCNVIMYLCKNIAYSIAVHYTWPLSEISQLWLYGYGKDIGTLFILPNRHYEVLMPRNWGKQMWSNRWMKVN